MTHEVRSNRTSVSTQSLIVSTQRRSYRDNGCSDNHGRDREYDCEQQDKGNREDRGRSVSFCRHHSNQNYSDQDHRHDCYDNYRGQSPVKQYSYRFRKLPQRFYGQERRDDNHDNRISHSASFSL